MNFIKKNAKDIQRGFDCEYDKPSVCPHCGLGMDGQTISPSFVDFDNGDKLMVQVCCCTACRRYYFFAVLLNRETRQSRFVFLYPQYEYMYFNKNLNRVSPRFMSMYNQALRCEGNGDTEIAAIGYKAALDILVKDYAINMLKVNKDSVKNKNVFTAIKEYLGTSDIIKSEEAVRALTSEYAYYEGAYPMYDFVLLKLYMDIFIKYVETKVITNEEPFKLDDPKETRDIKSQPQSKPQKKAPVNQDPQNK